MELSKKRYSWRIVRGDCKSPGITVRATWELPYDARQNKQIKKNKTNTAFGIKKKNNNND